MRAKLILEYSMELPDDFQNSPANRTALLNDLKDELPDDIELNKLLLFTEPRYNNLNKYDESIA